MHETDTANPMLSERYRKDPMRPVSRAELYAWQQQDSLRWKGEYLDMGSCVTFEFNSVTVFDPWLKEGSPEIDHNSEDAVDPYAYYGTERMDAFVRRTLMKREGISPAHLRRGDVLRYKGSSWSFDDELYEVFEEADTYVDRERARREGGGMLCIVQELGDGTPMCVPLGHLDPQDWELV